jgi:hypothetical protein
MSTLVVGYKFANVNKKRQPKILSPVIAITILQINVLCWNKFMTVGLSRTLQMFRLLQIFFRCFGGFGIFSRRHWFYLVE